MLQEFNLLICSQWLGTGGGRCLGFLERVGVCIGCKVLWDGRANKLNSEFDV